MRAAAAVLLTSGIAVLCMGLVGAWFFHQIDFVGRAREAGL